MFSCNIFKRKYCTVSFLETLLVRDFHTRYINNIDKNGTICNTCRIKVYNIDRTIYNQTGHLPTTVVEFTKERSTCDSQDDVDELVTIPMMSVNKSHNICAICRVKIKAFVCMG